MDPFFNEYRTTEYPLILIYGGRNETINSCYEIARKKYCKVFLEQLGKGHRDHQVSDIAEYVATSVLISQMETVILVNEAIG